MDCPRCGAPLRADEANCRFCGRGRDQAQPAPVPVGGGAAPGTFSNVVEIFALGNNKIMVIKALREALKIGLKEAKDLTDHPLPLRVSVDPSRSAKLLAALQEAGANARFAC